LEQSEEKTRSAEETVNFLNDNFGPDECDRLALIATLIGKAVYEKEPNEAHLVFRLRTSSTECAQSCDAP
jgi:hypothetical protein